LGSGHRCVEGSWAGSCRRLVERVIWN
jgi:hypothetical protein